MINPLDPEELEIKAQLIPVARDLVAHVGDKLMIVAGVCIGVYSGKRLLLTQAKPPAMGAAPARAAATPQHVRKLAQQANKSRQKPTPSSDADRRKAVLDMLRGFGGAMTGPMVAQQQYAGFSSYHFYKAAKQLIDAGQITKNGVGQLVTYQILTPKKETS